MDVASLRSGVRQRCLAPDRWWKDCAVKYPCAYLFADSSTIVLVDLSQPYTAICPSLEGPVLEVLAHTNRPLTGRDVARLARRGSERGVRLVLHRLVAHGLVIAQEAGPASLFVLNRDHVAASIVEGLMRLRAELIERVRREVDGWASQPIHASIFGSAARGDGGSDSDIDLLIVRPDATPEDDPRWREQSHLLAEKIERWSGNHASLHELSPAQLRAAARRKEPIITSLSEESITLAGADFADLMSSRRQTGIAP
jgi:predicted nucleotidyltransferase